MTLKNNSEKKMISILLCVALVVALIPLSSAFAELKNLDMKKGVISMVFEDKKATSKITYHTVGFIVHKESDENRAAAYSQPYGAMIDKKFQQIGEEDSGGGNVTTYFKMAKEDVGLAMYNAGMGTWKDGQTIYLDSVFEVLHNGVSTGSYYYTYDEIANAEGWSAKTKEDLKAYYNIKLTYHGDKFPVNKKIILNGKEISNEVAASVASGETQKITFENSVTKDGVTGTIKKSYIETNYDKGKQNFVVESGDPAVTERNIIQVIGGSTVVAEYESAAKVTVRYLDMATQRDIAPYKEYEAKPGDTLKEQAQKIQNYAYDYSIYSPDDGKTWTGRTSDSARSDKAGVSTLIHFYYKSLGGGQPPDITPPDGGGQPPDIIPTPGGGHQLAPKLSLSCDPQAIEKGKRATVEFVLDASGCFASNGIDYYNFWFNDTGKFDTLSPNLKLQKSPVVTFSRPDVKPNTKWYGRVQMVDKKGNAEFAYAEVTIGEFEPEPAAEAHAVLNVKIVQNDPKIREWDDEYGWVGLYYLTIGVPADWDRNEKMRFSFALDGAESNSTNGIGSYRFTRMGDSEGDSMSGPAAVKTLNQRIEISPQEYIDKYLNQGKEWTESGYLKFRLQVEDSIEPSATDQAFADVMIRYVFEKGAPQVELTINQDTFAKGETAEFTPSFEENDDTYPIKDKHWEILDQDENVIDSGKGEIPSEYPIYLAPGDYTGRQTITYENDKKEDCEESAEVPFKVYDISPPDVSIACDKEKYVIPATGLFTTSFVEDANYTFPIAKREYALKNENGAILAQGDGIFPEHYNFTLEMDGGYYTASQTIHWWESGVAKEKTAECRFKLISPKPAADFRVNMKMSTAANDWKRIDVAGETGKVFKQIRIDLSPSIALNEQLENPYPIKWDNPNTQMQIIPLNPDDTENKEKIAKVYTFQAADLVRKNGVGTITAKQFMDVRFDEPGSYKIKCRVANEGYVGNWLEKVIVIREDLPPIVDINLNGVVAEASGNKIYRNTNDLSVQFGAVTSARSQDEDSVDYNTARLDIAFDYNGDLDSSNDGIHSQMSVGKTVNKLQPYITVSKNDAMTNFTLRFLSNTFPILGKIKLEYSVAEKPKIPNYTGGALPAVPEIRGTTELLPEKKKAVMADNTQGIITLDVAKDNRIEITVLQDGDSLHFDLQALKKYYGDTAIIFIVDKNGNRTAVN